jgi:hypothetical protein
MFGRELISKIDPGGRQRAAMPTHERERFIAVLGTDTATSASTYFPAPFAYILVRVAIIIFRDWSTRKGGGETMITLKLSGARPSPARESLCASCVFAHVCGATSAAKRSSRAATPFRRATFSSRCGSARITSRSVNAAERKLHTRER